MKQFMGKAVNQGVAIGSIHILHKQQYETNEECVQDTKAEISRFMQAKEMAAAQVQEMYSQTYGNGSVESAAILQAQLVMLEDEEYLGAVCKKIEQEAKNAEFAVYKTGEEYARMFLALEDAYVRARAADVGDITERLIGCMQKNGMTKEEFIHPVILVAEDLSPSEAISLDKSKILAIATSRGSVHSHTAILAKTMNIPAVVETDVDLAILHAGEEAIVDGFSGEFIIMPDEWQKAHVRREFAESQKQTEKLQELIGKDTVTRSGKRIALMANAGSMDDVKSAIQNDAEGIGLLRSEFLYLGKENAPTEEEQFLLYKQILKSMKDKTVVIRTLDIGADKKPDYIELEKEENPAMGFRAIRVCLQKPEIIRTQLRALYRASVYGNLSIMYPMVISAKEIEEVLAIAKEVKEELAAENIPYKEVKSGIMIETPAAAIICDELAPLVDFFSIGTNDLTQYTLAIDRQNGRLDAIYDPYHKAVLRMIQTVVQQGHKAGIPVGICGELAADTKLTEWFMEIGLDELSVTPASILKLRQIIRETE